MLGKVDYVFIIQVRSKRYNIIIDHQLNVSVNNLFTFVNNIIATNNYTNKDIIICGSVLPIIKDSTDKKFLNGARRQVDISQLERTKKTIEYNNLLNNSSFIQYNNDTIQKISLLMNN